MKQKYEARSNGSKIYMHGIRQYACVIYNAILNSLYAVPKKTYFTFGYTKYVGNIRFHQISYIQLLHFYFS